jgi:hypothetical protein
MKDHAMCKQNDWELDLTPEQITEIERRLSEDEPFATDDEVKATFERIGVTQPDS